MAFPLTPAIVAGASLLGQGANAWAQGKMNKKTRAFNEDMYKVQRNDAYWDWMMQNEYNQGLWNQQNMRDDQVWNRQNEYMEGIWNKQNAYNEQMWQRQNEYNEQQWNKQNEYNSPEAQMNRFKEAGLNPNLIYGQGTTAGPISVASFNASTHGSASQPGGSRPGSAPHSSAPRPGWTPTAPNFDMNQGIMAFFNARQTTAQVNNLEATNEVVKQDAALRRQQVVEASIDATNKVLQGKGLQLDLDTRSELRQHQVEAVKLSNKRAIQEMDLAVTNAAREGRLAESTIGLNSQHVKNLKGQNYNNALEAMLREHELELQRMGIEKGDPAYYRLGVRLGNKVKNYIDNNF